MSVTHGLKIFGTSPVLGVAPVFTLLEPNNSSSVGGFTNQIQSVDVQHVAEKATSKNASGKIDAVNLFGEYITCTMELFPTGASTADALVAMTLPPMGSTVQISGAKVFRAGPFTDALNTGILSRWIYEGGGSIRLSSTGEASMSLPLSRYPDIPATAAAIIT